MTPEERAHWEAAAARLRAERKAREAQERAKESAATRARDEATRARVLALPALDGPDPVAWIGTSGGGRLIRAEVDGSPAWGIARSRARAALRAARRRAKVCHVSWTVEGLRIAWPTGYLLLRGWTGEPDTADMTRRAKADTLRQWASADPLLLSQQRTVPLP